jgi:hypothetical protein
VGQEPLEDEWTATDHKGDPQSVRAYEILRQRDDLGSAGKPGLDLTAPPAGCPAGNSCTGAAFPGHPAHAIDRHGVDEILHLIDNPPTAKELADRRNVEALEGVLESDEGYHVIGEVPRGKPAVEGVTSRYWVVPTTGDRLTDRHDVLGPYADLDMAEWKRDQYIEAGHSCEVLQSVTRPTPNPTAGDVAYRLRNTSTGTEYLVLGTSLAANAPHMTSVWVQEVGEIGAKPWSPDVLVSHWHDIVAVDEHGQPRPPFAIGDQVLQLDNTPAEVFEVVGETVFARTANGEVYEHEVDELRHVDTPPDGEHDATCANGCTHQHQSAGLRVVTMTLAEYIASVAVTVSAVQRAAMGVRS